MDNYLAKSQAMLIPQCTLKNWAGKCERTHPHAHTNTPTNKHTYRKYIKTSNVYLSFVSIMSHLMDFNFETAGLVFTLIPVVKLKCRAKLNKLCANIVAHISTNSHN